MACATAASLRYAVHHAHAAAEILEKVDAFFANSAAPAGDLSVRLFVPVYSSRVISSCL